MDEARDHGKLSALDLARARLDHSRAQLRGRFTRPAAGGAGVRVGLGIAALLLTSMLRRRARAGGVGMMLTLGLAAVQMLRRKP
jgi:hypothetical protein